MNTKKRFSPEFKIEAASAVLDDGLNIREACEAFGVGQTAMRRWVNQLREERGGYPGSDRQALTPEQRRIRDLEAQVKQLKQEKDILKKATAFFIQEQTGKR